MSELNLPEGWVETSLDSISSDVSYGYTAKSTTEKVGPHLLRITDIQDNQVDWKTVPFCEIKKGKVDQYLLKADDLVFARTGATVGKSFLIKGNIPESVFASYLIRVRSVKQIGINYLAHFFNSATYWNQITEFSSGIGQPNVNGTKLKELNLPLAPLAEQQQIAQKLDELLAQVETLKTRLDAIPKILKRFRQSVLAAAVSGRLTEEWRGSGEKWPEKKLREICLSISDGDHQAPPRADSGIPFLVISNVNKGFIDFSKVERWVPQYYFDELKDLRRPKRNDILYTVTGSFGIPVLVDTDQDFCFQRHIAILKPNADFLNYKFLFFLLGSSQAFKQADSVATGTAQRTVALNSLRDFEFGIPPLEEQTEIVRRVEQLFAYADQIEQRVKDAQARVNHLTQSILAKAFRGELTADWRAQTPELISGENSAAALLERIRVEREELKQQVKPKRTAVKKKTGNSMSKQIIKVVDALKKAGEPLSGQQLLTAAGYSSDSNTEELEKFFLDIRDALTIEKSIVKLERSEDGQDWFNLPETAADR